MGYASNAKLMTLI